MAYVIALTSGGGVPLFTRTIGDFEAVSIIQSPKYIATMLCFIYRLRFINQIE